MRSIADQDVDQLGGPGSVLVRQRHDHEELDRLLDAVERSTGTEQDALLPRLQQALDPAGLRRLGPRSSRC